MVVRYEDSLLLRWGKLAVLFVALCLAWAEPAMAETEIRFEAPNAGRDLRGSLAASSLLLEARRDGTEDPQELLAAARADYARLLGVLYQHGRFGGVINILIDGREAATIPPLAELPRIDDILLRVEPGPVYVFSDARIGPLAPRTELPEGFAPGAPAAVEVIRGAGEAAIVGWRRAGHAKARIGSQRIVARHDARAIAAELAVDPGPVLRFGDISVSGNRDVRTARIRKIAGLEEGRRFDPDEIARAERRLRRTGSFRSVVVSEADEIAEGDLLPLEIGVVEQVPRRFGFGAEISSIEGVGLTGFWLHRNLLGGAERFRVEGEASGIGGETGGVDYTIGVRYERPATPRADIDLFAETGFELLDEPDFKSTSAEFTVGFTRYATDELTVNFGVGYVYSDVEDDFGNETYSLLTLPLGATLERRDVPLNPTRGVFVDLGVTPFYGIADSESGMQVKMDVRGYKSFGADRPVTAALRFQLGSLIGPTLLGTPPDFRFYSGGGGTVRGQDYQSLAVDLGGGNRTGGRSFAAVSAEARIPVTDAISVVGFYDWGFVGEESTPFTAGDSHAGAGLGLRYETGLGPIRLDIATPVSGDTGSSGVYIYVGIGQAF